MAHGPAVWLPFIQPFGTVFLGIGAATVAYRQWRTAHNRLRLDLFDKRLANFNSVMNQLDVFRKQGFLSPTSRLDLDGLLRASDLLYGKDMFDRMNKARDIVANYDMPIVATPKNEQAIRAGEKVDKLQFEMRTVLRQYAGMSRVR